MKIRNFLNFWLDFLKNVFNIKDFFNIWIEENEIRESFGNEYVERFGTVNQKNGRKIISPKKIISRLTAIFVIILIVFFIYRINTDGGYFLNKQ